MHLMVGSSTGVRAVAEKNRQIGGSNEVEGFRASCDEDGVAGGRHGHKMGCRKRKQGETLTQTGSDAM